MAERVTSAFGKPRRIIAWGDSRGGNLALAIAELYPEWIDAALPKCIYGGRHYNHEPGLRCDVHSEGVADTT